MSSVSTATCGWRISTSVERLHLRRVVDRAARVVRRVEHQPAGARRDRLLEAFGLQPEALLRRAVDEHRRAFRQAHDVRVRDPVGRRNDDLVARLEAAHQRVEDHLLGAGADDELVRARSRVRSRARTCAGWRASARACHRRRCSGSAAPGHGARLRGRARAWRSRARPRSARRCRGLRRAGLVRAARPSSWQRAGSGPGGWRSRSTWQVDSRAAREAGSSRSLGSRSDRGQPCFPID